MGRNALLPPVNPARPAFGNALTCRGSCARAPMSVRADDRGVDRTSLRALLDSERVRRDAYAIDGSVADEALCLQPTRGGWMVFYSERGLRTGERWFETEHEACDYLAARLLADSETGPLRGADNALACRRPGAVADSRMLPSVSGR